MAVRALSLSGGGSRGSFQLGALTAIYNVYGFRPDVIAGTSVGSVNGIKLALAQPPAVNDPVAILAAAATGTVDSGLAALRALEAEWETFTSTDDFFRIQPAFRGTMVEDLLGSLNAAPSGDGPLMATLGPKIDEYSVWLSIPVVNLVTGPIAADTLQKAKGAIGAALSENSVFNLDPVETRLNDPTKLTRAGLVAGTPVYLAVVALESGQLRYVDGRGRFTERDGLTPVVSALMDSDIDAALDENLQPLDTARRDRLKDLNRRYRAAIAAIGAAHDAFNQPGATRAQRVAALGTAARNTERGNYLVDVLRNMVRGLRISTNVDPRRGVLASAAMPVFFAPIELGAERYVDGGVREIIPLEIAIRAGVTDVVGICCSSRELPAADNKAKAGLPAVGMRALTEIALGEVTHGDIEAVRARGIPCTVIAPTFDVHGATVVDPTLIEISSDYGWMRACDEMQPVEDAQRPTYRRFADLITTLRLRSYELESFINHNAWFLNAASTTSAVSTVRTCRWMIRELIASRAERGLPTHPRARRWWTGWVRTMRPLGPFNTSSVWSKLSAFSANGTEVLVANEVANPDTYAPDGGSLVDAGNDRLYWIVRGAVFRAEAENEQTSSRPPVLPVPYATVTGLPRIPRGSHLMAEQDTPGEVWIVRGGKRYRATPALITASAVSGPVAIVPPGGLDQIPDGGGAHWLGGLYISDNVRAPIEQWEPTPQAEGSTTTTSVGLTNRSPRAVTVSALSIATGQDSGGSRVFTVTTPLPTTVPANTFVWVNATFRPQRPGPITGTVTVTCDDPDVAQFGLPLSTAAIPLGAHGELQITPGGLDLGAVRVGRTAGQHVTLTNTGGRSLDIVDLRVTGSAPAGQFAIPFSLPTQLAPGQGATVYVSCTPTVRGRLTATLAADVRSATNTAQPFLQHVEVPLAATAQAPVVVLAGVPLPPPRPRPIRFRELQRLDFGAAAPGVSVLRTFWVRNGGDLPLTVGGVDTTNQSAFGIPDASGFPAVIAPGGELAIEANFLAPLRPGTLVAGELGVQTDDPLRPRAVLVVAGRTAGPHLTLQPPELVDLGAASPPSGTLVITSDGTDPVNLVKVGVDDGAFTFTGFPAIPTALAPGTSLTITITYTGAVPGVHQGRLALSHDATTSQGIVFLRAQV